MRFRHLFALGIATVGFLVAVPASAEACWFKKSRPRYIAPAPMYCPPAPGPYYPAPPMYPAPRTYYGPPTAPHIGPGMAPAPVHPAIPAGPMASATVAAKDNVFDPVTLTVPPGATVRWVNNGRNRHTVTDRGGKFDSGDIAPGSSFTHTFPTPGTYRYYCKHHKEMEGTIVVGEPKKMPAGGGAGSTKKPSDD